MVARLSADSSSGLSHGSTIYHKFVCRLDVNVFMEPGVQDKSAMLQEGAHLPYAFAYDKADGVIIVQRGSVARINAADVDGLRMRAVDSGGEGQAEIKRNVRVNSTALLLPLVMRLLSGSFASTDTLRRVGTCSLPLEQCQPDLTTPYCVHMCSTLSASTGTAAHPSRLYGIMGATVISAALAICWPQYGGHLYDIAALLMDIQLMYYEAFFMDMALLADGCSCHNTLQVVRP
ncbi:unnamed protein product [Acanthocheilonema viteae]|uniref:Uncharacterized protein n=1 Tax=Acanthocheilonema viteae TaxID=6277 RepID=A0A498SAJ8_ACAVI|nr:unnamed protein product [Acanthocheilonema viteae]